MAAAQLNLSRRALLGAAFASPVLPRHSGLDPESTFPFPTPQGRWTPDQVRGDGKWERALARYSAAEAALAAVAHSDDEELYDRLGARHDTALRRLLRTPAPNLAALALKLDLALDDRAVEFVADASAMKTLKHDARRLAESGPSHEPFSYSAFPTV